MKGLFLLLALCGSTSFAGQGGSGGRWTESDFKYFLARLVPYITSAEGKALFPEVVEFDRTHPKETVEKILTDLNPSLVDHAVYDSQGNERDCVSGFDKVRFFQCNLDSLPPKPDEKTSDNNKSEYYGSLYRLVLHEGFVQAGLEKPLVKEVPSEYTLSSRLSVHLEIFPEWVPGKDSNANKRVIDTLENYKCDETDSTLQTHAASIQSMASQLPSFDNKGDFCYNASDLVQEVWRFEGIIQVMLRDHSGLQKIDSDLAKIVHSCTKNYITFSGTPYSSAKEAKAGLERLIKMVDPVAQCYWNVFKRN